MDVLLEVEGLSNGLEYALYCPDTKRLRKIETNDPVHTSENEQEQRLSGYASTRYYNMLTLVMIEKQFDHCR